MCVRVGKKYSTDSRHYQERERGVSGLLLAKAVVAGVALQKLNVLFALQIKIQHKVVVAYKPKDEQSLYWRYKKVEEYVKSIVIGMLVLACNN